MKNKEFEIGQLVTIDRYNHIKDVEIGVVVGYGEMPISHRLTYKIRLKDVVIQTTGISIMESKNYEPVPDNERHHRINYPTFEEWEKGAR